MKIQDAVLAAYHLSADEEDSFEEAVYNANFILSYS